MLPIDLDAWILRATEQPGVLPDLDRPGEYLDSRGQVHPTAALIDVADAKTEDGDAYHGYPEVEVLVFYLPENGLYQPLVGPLEYICAEQTVAALAEHLEIPIWRAALRLALAEVFARIGQGQLVLKDEMEQVMELLATPGQDPFGELVGMNPFSSFVETLDLVE